MNRIRTIYLTLAGWLFIASSAFAGDPGSASSEGSRASMASAGSYGSVAASVPELDGGMALIALALTAAIIAIVKERRRS